MIKKDFFKRIYQGIGIGVIIIMCITSCGPKETATDEIKKKVDSLDKEIMKQLDKKQEKEKGQ